MKVGDYVRTHDGRIDKIVDIKNDYVNIENSDYGYSETYLTSSSDIIDLIEVGDYVNGYYVEDVRDVFDGEDIYTRICLASGCNYFQPDITEKEDIKSIVTKEQFESMEYKL